ncbi:MAG: hypothetical protein CM1200mP20_03100 [Pseudomonadota bacterium]|nr:MAG: hypothetical protein CM1200mP20_03100 [Pseudomonadota bacterium]
MADQRSMHLPDALKEPVLSLAHRVLAACEQGQRIVDELDEWLRLDLEGEVARVDEMITELGRLRVRPTASWIGLPGTLCDGGRVGVATVFWHQIILWTANLADLSERVGNRLRL